MTGMNAQGPKNTKEEFDEELHAGRRAIEIFGDLVNVEPDALKHRERLVATYDNVSIFYRKADNHDEAVTCQRKALQIGEPLVASRAGLLLAGMTVSHVFLDLSEQLISRGDWAGARPLYERHRELVSRLIAEFPRVPNYRDQLRIALFRLSQMNLAAGRLEEAEHDSRQVLVLTEQLLRDNPDLALLPPRMTSLARFGSEHRDLAEILVAQGRLPEAISYYTKGIAILEEVIQRQPLDINAPLWLDHLRARGPKHRRSSPHPAKSEAPTPEAARGLSNRFRTRRNRPTFSPTSRELHLVLETVPDRLASLGVRTGRRPRCPR